VSARIGRRRDRENRIGHVADDALLRFEHVLVLVERASDVGAQEFGDAGLFQPEVARERPEIVDRRGGLGVIRLITRPSTRFAPGTGSSGDTPTSITM
jgi:hypothetical protein